MVLVSPVLSTLQIRGPNFASLQKSPFLYVNRSPAIRFSCLRKSYTVLSEQSLGLNGAIRKGLSVFAPSQEGHIR